MQKEWLGIVVQGLMWVVFMTITMGWLNRSRMRRATDAERRVLRHPVSTLVVGLIGSGFFFGIAVVSNTIGKNATSTVWTTALFIGFGCLSLPMLADYFLARHRLSDAGIEYRRMLGTRGSLNWSDVASVGYRHWMKWFVLESTDGNTVRVSAMLMGLPEFARLLLLHVPEHRIEPPCRITLRQTRDGHPPSLWH
jgi:hypothetical protein